jgi:hypothetical protein
VLTGICLYAACSCHDITEWKRPGQWSKEAAGTGLADTRALQTFKSTIGKFAAQFAGYNQQDVSEFLAFLIDGLHEELNEIEIKPYVELDTDGKSDQELAAIAWDYYQSRERSVIYDAFYGQLKSTLQCKVCGHCSTSFDPFSSIPVSLPLPEKVMIEVPPPAHKYPDRNSELTEIDLRFEIGPAELCCGAGGSLLAAKVAGGVRADDPSGVQAAADAGGAGRGTRPALGVPEGRQALAETGAGGRTPQGKGVGKGVGKRPVGT